MYPRKPGLLSLVLEKRLWPVAEKGGGGVTLRITAMACNLLYIAAIASHERRVQHLFHVEYAFWRGCSCHLKGGKHTWKVYIYIYIP